MPFDGAKFKFSEVTCYRFRVRVMDGMLIIDDGDGVDVDTHCGVVIIMNMEIVMARLINI